MRMTDLSARGLREIKSQMLASLGLFAVRSTLSAEQFFDFLKRN